MTQKAARGNRLVFIPIAFGLIVMHAVLKAAAGDWGVAGGIVAVGVATMVAYRKLQSMGPKEVEAPDRHLRWHRFRN